MSRGEEALVRSVAGFFRRDRSAGLKILLASLALGVAGVLPLCLYIVFGPKDGNPIGLGLLAAAAVPVAGIGAVIGLVGWIAQVVARRGS